MRLARRAGMKKAKVALARKLAVILHRMRVDAMKFDAVQSERLRARSSLTERSSRVFGRATTPAFPKRSPVAGTMDQVRPYARQVALRPRVP